MIAMKTIAVIGGGAAGLAAAVCAAREARACSAADTREAHAHFVDNAREARDDAAVRVVIYEADERVGRSILATGNGRCNFTNAVVDAGVYRNATFVAQTFQQLELTAASRGVTASAGAACPPSAPSAPNAVQAFFADLGLEWREEGEGRMYPYANKASSVLDVLRGAALALGVEERCNCEVVSIDPPASSGGGGSRFTLKLADRSFERADAVILACGGKLARALLPDGFAFTQPEAILGPLATDTGLAKQLDNIRVRGVARLFAGENELACETGEILFRKYGLSGIAIFNLSRFAQAGNVIELDMLPFLDSQPSQAVDAGAQTIPGASQAAVPEARSCEGYVLSRYDRLYELASEKPTCATYLRGLLLPQVARVVAKDAGFDEHDVLERSQAPALLAAFRKLRFTCEGIADPRQCQVHRGGFEVGGFDPCSMESKLVDDLYLVGEALDVDAPCGGYNLHWAWASGMLAGWSAVDKLLGCRAATGCHAAKGHRGGEGCV